MFIIFFAAIILLTWKWADWRNWNDYLPTMQFFAIGNLLYAFFYKGHYLWQFKGDIVQSPVIITMFFNFIVFPLTVLLFLSNYPSTLWKQVLYNIKYIAIYLFLEWFYLKIGMFEHNYGWNLWCSAAWDCIMFPILALHHKNPLLAYGASLIVVIVMLILFPVTT